MADLVPDFEFDFPPSTRGERALRDEDIMELLWQNGQVVAQSQNHRQFKKSTIAGDAEVLPLQPSSNAREIPSVDAGALSRQPQPQNEQHRQQFFMQEAEMASWLHYPLDEYSLDREMYSDILDSSSPAPVASNALASPPREIRSSVTETRPPPPSLPPPIPMTQSTSVATRPPLAPPPRRPDVVVATPNFQNFINFSRIPRARMESGQPSSSKAVRESTMVESNDTPVVQQESRLSLAAGSSAQPSCWNVESLGASTSAAAREYATTCDRTLTLSPGGSGGSFSASVEPTPPLHKPTLCSTQDRKRKERELEDADRSEDLEFESAEAKKQARGSASGKKSRAAEVHNLSERRRRDRINEKMRTLQELIPRCNKSDKASMLDEAIEYLKSLQLQVQMMSMGCGMVPMMYPGVQQYMPAMGAGMGLGMGMGIGMDMGANQPIMPYPPHFPGSGFPLPAAANMAPRFAMPGFQLQPIPVPNTARMQASSQPDPTLNLHNAQGPNQSRMPGFMDPYQQFIGLHHAQVPLQSQVVVQPSSTRPSSDKAAGKPENNKTG